MIGSLQHPEQTRDLSRQLFKELGVWKLAKGASWIGIDVQQRTIDSLVEPCRIDAGRSRTSLATKN